VVATPVEFGGANLMPADPVKQGQKGLVGALSIMPAGSTWTEGDLVTDHQRSMTQGFLRRTRTMATITSTTPPTRDFVAVVQPGISLRYAGDGAPVEGIAAEGVISEDAEDSGQIALNYGAEPMWYRFGLAPNVPFSGSHAAGAGPSMGTVPNAHEAYSNGLASAGGEDPSTAVFTAQAGQPFRFHLLVPAGHARASVFNLHGHVWQRAPYMCPGSAYLGLPGLCKPTGFYPTEQGFEVGSRALGSNPISSYFGGQDSILPASHFDFVLPSAGGRNAVKGDYLFRDQASFGNTAGFWGILRVQ
jgi:hypothetical protein